MWSKTWDKAVLFKKDSLQWNFIQQLNFYKQFKSTKKQIEEFFFTKIKW